MPLIYPPKPRPGDRVAIVSPAAGLPGLFPLPYELGLRRLETDFGLHPVEYPATRTFGSTPRERAADLHAAFADPTIKAVIATIGGDDQITVLPHLDAELIAANPKPVLRAQRQHEHAGVAAQPGHRRVLRRRRHGAVRPARRHAPHDRGLAQGRAVHAGGVPAHREHRVRRPGQPLEDARTFDTAPRLEPSTGWIWHRPDYAATSRSWGGNLEILSWLMMAGKEINDPAHYDGAILFFETSEETPKDVEVYRILRNMGERGLLQWFAAVLVGRAKSWFFTNQDTDRATCTAAQRAAVLKAFSQYAPETMIVFDVDLGHTDPQVVIPVGGTISIDGPKRTITVTY